MNVVVIVAAPVTGNDAVAVIDAVIAQPATGPADKPRRSGTRSPEAHLDVMKIDELIKNEPYERRIELLERIVAMLTKLVDP